jgi:uroporphyrinogen decarboxylase
MKARERELAAIRHLVPDRIPVDVIQIDNQPAMAAYLGVQRPTVTQHMGFYNEVYKRLGIDGRHVCAPYTGDTGQAPSGEPLHEWGYVRKADCGTAHWYPLADAETVADVDKHPWPSVDRFDFEAAGRLARDWGREYAVRGPHWWPLLCRVFHLTGMEEGMVKMVANPTAFEATLNKVEEITAEYSRRLMDACGEAMPILCVGDDFATQTGMLIAEADWRRYLKPRYARLFALGKQAGKYIWFHSCGNITNVLPDLIDIGMDVWETVQLHTLPLTPKQLKTEYGRHITFFGGVNSQRFPFMGDEELQNEVRRTIDDLAEGGGYIGLFDHSINDDCDPAKVVLMFDTARAYRRSDYTQRPNEETSGGSHGPGVDSLERGISP